MKLKISVIRKNSALFAEVEIYKDDLKMGRKEFVDKCVNPALDVLFDALDQEEKDG